MRMTIVCALALLPAVALAGKWDAARAEWQSFCKDFEPDYSDGAKCLQPPEDHRFAEPFVLVKDGKPAAKIVWHAAGWYTDRFSTKVTETAAKELQALVKMLTGVKLPIYDNEAKGEDLPAVMLGKGTFYPFDEQREIRHPKAAFSRLTPEMVRQAKDDLRTLRGTDGFAIRLFGRDVFVYGTCEKGTLNGVYRLVEENSDVIFVRPNEEIGVVHGPVKKDFALVWGQGVLEKPTLVGRGFWNIRHARYWNANLGTTTASDAWSDDHFKTFGSHNSSHFVPAAAERPDLHGLVSGKRGDYGYMLCFSNPDLLPTFRENVLSRMDTRAPRELSGLQIALDDTMNWCSCENCRKPLVLADGMSVPFKDPAFMSTQFFRLLNDSAGALAAVYPGLQIGTLAYFQTAEPPKCPVSENLVVGYCPYMRVNDLAPVFCEENEIWIDRLERWAEKVPDRRRLYLRGYDGLGLAFPRPLGHVHQRDWRLYQKYVIGMNHENPGQAWDRIEKDGKPTNASLMFDYSAIEFWVMSRLMWNVEEDVESLYKRFCYRAFREAAKPMERFYGTIRRDWMRSGRQSSIGENGLNATKVYILDVPGREKELRGYLDEALIQARHSVSKELIRRVKARFEHFISEIRNAKTSALVVPQIVPAEDPGFDDADWKNAAAIDRFYEPMAAAQGRDVEGKYPVRVDLFHDGRALYFRATMWEDMAKISSSAPKGGEEVFGSKLEVFFGDNSAAGQYTLFRVDNAGGFADYRGYDGSWNRKLTQYAVRKFDDRWVVTMKVPLEEIGMNLIADNKLKAAFIRVRETADAAGKSEYTSWKFSTFHKLTSFGTLTLQR